MKDILIFLAMFGTPIVFYLAIMWAFSRGAKWSTLKNDFPDFPYSQSYFAIKNVVRCVGTLRMSGKGGMKVRFTDAGLRVTSRSPFFAPLLIPYDRVKIHKLYRLRGLEYIYLKIDHEVEFDVILPDITKNLVEKHIGSMEGMPIEQKYATLDVGIG